MSSNKSLSIKTANNPAANPEIIKVAADANQVACDGGHPTLGHPITYYTFDNVDVVECGYCDRKFIKKSK
jgi:uncharacterized Zn-finger protein